MAPLPRISGAAFALACALSLGACGTDVREDVHADPRAVFESAMEAVHAGDWKTLRPLLTREARANLERDLTRLRRRLAHPEDGKQERRIAKARLGADYDAELERAVNGTLSDVLRFFAQRISPRPRHPKAERTTVERFRAEILYADGEGTLRPVRLVRLAEGWFVANLQL